MLKEPRGAELRLEPGAVVAFLLALGVYAPSVGFGFVMDDTAVIQHREIAHSLGAWREILTAPWVAGQLYRPAALLSLAVDWVVSGGHPGWFHAVNAVLHAVAAVLVYLLARPLLGALGTATAAVLFAVHPVHVDAVASVVGRAELLAAVFVLAAALAYRADGDAAARGERGRTRWGVALLCLAAAAAGFASKENALVLPGVLLILDWADARVAGGSPARRVASHWPLLAAAVGVAVVWLGVRAAVMGSVSAGRPTPELVGLGLGDRFLVMAPVAVEWARLLFVPARLSADYSPDFLPVTPLLTAKGVAGLALVALAATIAIATRRTAPAVTFALAWIGGTVFVVANLVVPTGIVLAERTLYLPSVGAVVLLGWLAARAAERWRAAAVGGVALLAGLGLLRVATRLPVWHDNDAFMESYARDAPGSYRAFWAEGTLAYARGDLAGAEAAYRRAVVTFAGAPGVLMDLAHVLERREAWAEAARYRTAAFRLDSVQVEAAVEGATDWLRVGMADSAAALARAAASRFPDDYRFDVLRADAALALGRADTALMLRLSVARQFPTVWQYWYLVADAALAAGRCDEARRALGRIRALAPDRSERAALEARAEEGGCRAR